MLLNSSIIYLQIKRLLKKLTILLEYLVTVLLKYFDLIYSVRGRPLYNKWLVVTFYLHGIQRFSFER